MIEILRRIHSKQIIHRDIKPNNILFHAETKDVYLIDFGLSKMYTNEQGVHNPIKENAAFRGTYKFCSVSMHKGFE
jgi:serine/threonine protein kinase